MLKNILIRKYIIITQIYTIAVILCWLLVSCGADPKEVIIQNENYQVHIANNQTAVLILFPCYSCGIDDTKREAFFIKEINNQGITTILLNFNKKLYLTDEEKIKFGKEIQFIFELNKINGSNVFLGGFSSGGNIALLMGDYLSSQNANLRIKGVFVVDAPIDLEQLYYNSKNDVALNASVEARSEGEFLINLLESEIGIPKIELNSYKKLSPFLASQKLLNNLPNHEKYKIRLYTEPSPEWHLKNRKRVYNNTNSSMIERFHEILLANGNNSCELIKTVNRGVRANGNIHPHSWSIVEQKSLLEWMR